MQLLVLQNGMHNVFTWMKHRSFFNKNMSTKERRDLFLQACKDANLPLMENLISGGLEVNFTSDWQVTSLLHQ